MSELIVVGVRNHSCVVHWPGVRVLFALIAVCVLALSFVIEWFEHRILNGGGIVSPGERGFTVLPVSAFVTFGLVRMARRAPLEKLPSLEPLR